MATNDFKDRDKAFKSLTPSLQELRKLQAKKRMSQAYADKFAKIFALGQVPDWVIPLCDFETIEILTE